MQGTKGLNFPRTRKGRGKERKGKKRSKRGYAEHCESISLSFFLVIPSILLSILMS